MPTAVHLSIRWALVLGAVGFAAGFFGPMVLSPESNLGPIIGILVSGPGGAIAGAIAKLNAAAVESMADRRSASAWVISGSTFRRVTSKRRRHLERFTRQRLKSGGRSSRRLISESNDGIRLRACMASARANERRCRL